MHTLTAKSNMLMLFALVSPAWAQPSFSGFTPGNLAVTRSVYTGDATTVSVGQSLPPVCPASAACGTATATDNGAYPNVFNNNKVDGSFGVTSPIFIDQLTPTGTVVSTLAVPPNLLTTSFSSKSELAINLSQDGTAMTLVGYVAPPNTIDVSNSNAPGVYDPTNPAGGSYFRAVLQIGGNGALQVTPTNAYSGNNGRAAMLANGLYYIAGNDNNGSGTPTNIVTSTGVELAMPGQPATTAPTMVGTFSITQYNDPVTGKPYAADKLGKDNNFRGLTIFNNTLYVTKGSGGNGMNTVYQVGTAGTLPTLATAENTPITVLPGFPTTLAKNADVNSIFPFGILFANATTLYVGDEGDGVQADAGISTKAGLQKWSLVNGAWQLDYVLQKGLNLGTPYSVPNYPSSLNPATAGLRNISGRLNSDGTVTVWAVTSTVSANGDQGADPNKLVMINDVLANTSASGAANEQFTVIKSAAAGEVLRGVSLTPSSASTMLNVPLILSVASSSVQALAPGALASANGQNLAPGYPGPIFGVLPYVFGGTSVSIIDAAGNTSVAPLLYVAPDEIDFQVPATVSTGLAKVIVTNGATNQTAQNVQISNSAPALFTLNNAGLAAAYALKVSAAGAQSVEQIYSQNDAGLISAAPIDMGATTDKVYLILYGTGLDTVALSSVTATVNGVSASVLYAGSSGSVGLDQVNLLLPPSLAGAGNVNVQLSAGGLAANPVQITIQ